MAYGDIDARARVKNQRGTFSSTDSNTPLGWTVGAGVEVAFAQNWTIRGEYLYVDLGNDNFHFGRNLFRRPTTDIDFTTNILRVGLNYKF